MKRPYPDREGTRLWHALERAIGELEANGEVRIGTAMDYVVGYLCQELSAQGVVSPGGRAARPGREPRDATS